MKHLLLLALLYVPLECAERNQVVAATLVLEAGGEGKVGMQAVASVIQNRMKSKTAYDIVTAAKQFSCYNGYAYREDAYVAKAAKHPRYTYALALAKELDNKNVADITGGATHYHTTSIRPYWAKSLIVTKTIGNHIFYK